MRYTSPGGNYDRKPPGVATWIAMIFIIVLMLICSITAIIVAGKIWS